LNDANQKITQLGAQKTTAEAQLKDCQGKIDQNRNNISQKNN
jgi:hypothetical protein